MCIWVSQTLLKVLGILEFLPKLQKTASNKLAKLLVSFVSLAKFPLHLVNMQVFHRLASRVSQFANLLEAQFCNFGKNSRMPSSFISNPNSKLLENASFFTWHLVLRLDKTIDLSSEF